MSPSRGHATPAASHTAHSSKSHKHESDEDHHAVDQQSNSALLNAKRNLAFLINPASATAVGGIQPTFRTRALLRSLRYIGTFVFWRIVRWAKYAAVGALVAAVSATALGSAVTGVAWIAAPPTIGVSVLASVVWGVGKYAARRLNKRWKKTGGDQGHEMRERAQDRQVDRARDVMGPDAIPW